MFQSLANYLLGSVTSQDNGATAEGVENSSIRLTSVEQEDEWVLVDRRSDGNSETGSVASLEDADCNDELETYIPIPAILTRASSTSSLPNASNMEESWFVTPPPCFTSTGPIRMATSPLENLLIEHPSMSVYQHTLAGRFVDVTMILRPASASSNDSYEGELEVEEVEVEVEGDGQVAAQYRAPRLNRSQILQQQERQCLKSKRAQKAQMQKACIVINRGCLERTNKAREVNSRNRRQRRGERSQGATRSYANNNRKC